MATGMFYLELETSTKFFQLLQRQREKIIVSFLIHKQASKFGEANTGSTRGARRRIREGTTA